MPQSTSKKDLSPENQVLGDIQRVHAEGESSLDLDVYDSPRLRAFWSLTRNKRDLLKECLFKNRADKESSWKLRSMVEDALDDLGAYAIARSCVLEGTEVRVRAMYYEHCKIYYSNLPMWARFKRNEKGRIV